jgi:putative OPT family oligopeptide transporter
MEQDQTKTRLPANAYRELKPGEEYHPVMPADKVFPEVTPWSVMWGLVMAVIFSAAAAYSGLKIGQVLEAAIPISIIAVGASTAFKRKNALGQNVIIQSIGASSGVIVAGAIFTIPALYILNLDVNFWQIFFASMLGGFLGILFLIPFRKYFVKDMHGKFPFPEATATTEILITGEKGGAQAGTLVLSGLIGGIYDFMFTSLRLWEEVFTTRVLPYGAALADKAKMLFQLNVSSMIFGFGYLVGLKFSTIIAVGSLLSWFVFVPLINSIGDVVAGGAGVANPFMAMTPEAIFTEYVRPIGIGAIAMAGIIGILKSSGVIGTAFKLAFAGIFGSKVDTPEGDARAEGIRTQKDIKMTFILIFSLLTMVLIFVFLLTGVDVTLGQAIVAFLTVTIIAFLFTTVAANAIAIVGTNPVSGMTLMTLILSSVVLVQAGLKGETGMISALIIGGIVCTALSMAGGFITDLKIGYWLGSTPRKQESWKFLGTIISAATVGAVIFILNEAYGFTYTAETPEPLVAPQANAMAAVIQPLMSEADINWMLYGVGAIIALLLNFIGISPLAFALGMYLPLHLNTPLLVGGLISHFVKNSTKDEKLANARNQKGTLIASGFIAGAAIFGVVGALLKFFKINLNINPWPEGSHGPEILAIIMFAAIIFFFARYALSAKAEE